MAPSTRIAVVGLGYVGLPLAVALAKRYDVVGFDVDTARVEQLRAGRDRTGEVLPRDLAASTLAVTADPEALRGAEVYIVTVPTPVGDDRQPDLGAVASACETVGGVLESGAVVVLESTVYPGVTEDFCGPILARASGLEPGRDFFLGYSPERINPGDRTHTVERITKVVAGQTPEVAARLAEIYGSITEGGAFVARDIRTAEAAKVIENAQRDINIAFVNEVAHIFGQMGISIYDVLDAANTKWNFLDFRPGLVGGHCIGVDPYYLAHAAEKVGAHPEIILAGRRINDGMGDHIAERIHLAAGAPGRSLVLGLTFKENVPDLRNSKVIDVVRGLEARGHTVAVHDPLADPGEAKALYGVELLAGLDGETYDSVVCAVPHRHYAAFEPGDIRRLLPAGGLVADIKDVWRRLELPEGCRRWSL